MAIKKERFKTLFTVLEEPKRYNCPSGEGIREEYEYQYNEKNQKVLTKVREINSYLEIQQYKDDCDISKIIARAKAGDMSDFTGAGMYIDVTNLPDNLIDSQKEWQKMENFFYRQPVEVRKMYNNDINKFAADVGKTSWLINTGLLNPQGTKDPVAAKAPETTVPVPEPETKK